MGHGASQRGAAPLGRRLYRCVSGVPVWAALLLVALWTMPTVGLLVDSFRGSRRQQGFWTVATDPGQLTPENYDAVLARVGPSSMFESVISSCAIAIPATVVPIALAALAAYAFAFIEFRGGSGCFSERSR